MYDLSARQLARKDNNFRKNRKTTTITLRIDTDVMQSLYNRAEQDDISLNTLVNQVLKRYVEWDMYESKAGIIPLSKPVAKELFQRLSREDIIEMAKGVAKNAVYDIALFMKGGKLDPDLFVSWFLSRMKNCSEISETNVGGESSENPHTYIIKHDLGENWSLYHKALLESIFNDMLASPIHIGTTGSTLALRY
jgi:hypothetical protein